MSDANVTTATALAPTAPLPAAEEIRYDTAPPERRAEIDEAMKEISIDDSTSVLFFGTAAQDAVTGVADEMLEGVRNKATGAAGEALSEMVTTLRGLPVSDLESGRKPGMLQRVFRNATPIARMLQRYEHVRSQVDAVSNRLDAHTSKLMKDITLLDRLYEKTLEYFRRLEVYIAAGEQRLRQIDREVLPGLASEAQRTRDAIAAQRPRSTRATHD